jgi:DNA sulfur modification protein DndD
MKMTSLEISNLGVHKELKLDVASQQNRLIFLNGSNNHGKTSLLTALEFVLFNAELSGGNLSKLAARELEVGGSAEIRVRLKLLQPNGDVAVVTRVQPFERTAAGIIRPDGSSELDVTLISRDVTVQAESVPRPEEWLDSHFPIRFKDFVLFDGEKMTRFFDNRVKAAIENAVREIARIDYFEEVIRTVKKAQAELQSKQAKLASKSAEKLNAEIAGFQRQLDLTERNLETALRQRNSLQSEEKTLRPLIEGLKDGAKYLGENKKLRDEHEALLEEQKELKIEFRRVLWGAGISTFLAGKLKYPIEKQIEIADKAGRYPADFKFEALEDVMAKGVCICGNHIIQGSDSEAAIRALMERNLSAGMLGTELSSLKATLDRSIGLAQANHQEVASLIRRQRKVHSEIQANLLSQRELAPKLEGLSLKSDDVASILANYQQIQRGIDELKQTIPMWESEQRSKKLEISKRQKEFEAAIGNSASAQLLKRQADYLASVIAQSSDFGQSVLERARIRLESFVSERFGRTDGGRYKTQITDEFDVITLNQDGTVANLSSGQNMVKAYMFSFALRSVIGLSFPLIVDTPYGRLDEKNRMLVAETLSNMFKEGDSEGQQAVFLMHDGEYTPWVMEHFKDLNPLEYYLEHFDEEYEISHLREGIDPEWYKYSAWQFYRETEQSGGGK